MHPASPHSTTLWHTNPSEVAYAQGLLPPTWPDGGGRPSPGSG
ncbi:hypothetical protein [Streptomyces tanashiensis]